MAITRRDYGSSGVSRLRRRPRIFAIVAIALTTGVALSGLSLASAPAPAEAVTGGDFNAGNIISDAVFYNSDAMVPSQIQEFLNRQVTSCAAGYTCLKSFTENTINHPADAYCTSPYNGVAGQSAASIIYAAAQACGVNPQVLLVLLQKEQALVTSRSPSAAAYARATGFACPDTAPCAVDSLGFSNQVYKGARQYKIYRAQPNSFNYRAGRVNNIQYNPNPGCGSSPVYIENQATAGLYDYTPYQPNASALANLYGIGDGCGAYGNRNFWRIFSDWFGSTQGGGTLARTGANPQIYLVTADHKYPVNSGAVYVSLAALGPFQYTSQAYLDQFPTGIPATNLLRDPSNGSIYLAANGTKSKFTTCAMVATWGLGGSCGAYIDVMPSQLLKFVTGADVTAFPLDGSTGVIYSMANGVKRAVHSAAQITAIANGGPTAWSGFPSATLAAFPSGPDVLDPASVVKTASDPTLYLLTAGTSTLTPIDSGDVYSQFGAPSYTVITDGGKAASTVATSPLSIAVTCGSLQYIAGGGKLYAIPSASGLRTTTIDTANCAALPKASTPVTGALFLRQASNGYIYNITAGKKVFMSTMAQVNSLNGSNPLVLVPASDATMAGIPTQADVLAPASLQKTAGNSTIYFIDGASRKIPLSSFALAGEFGIRTYATASDAALSAYTATSSALTISVTCSSVRYLAGGGSLVAVTSADPGLPSTSLDAATCAALPKSSQSISGAVFLRLPSTGSIYFVSNGVRQFVTTMDRVNALNGSNPLVFVATDQDVLNAIPAGVNLS